MGTVLIGFHILFERFHILPKPCWWGSCGVGCRRGQQLTAAQCHSGALPEHQILLCSEENVGGDNVSSL